jgi:hypothetical protein
LVALDFVVTVFLTGAFFSFDATAFLAVVAM